jgi:Na+-driven multidrug efflux pump
MSFYHGKEDPRAFWHTYRLGVRTNVILPVLLTAFCFVFSDGIVSLFRAGNPELTALAGRMLRLYPLAYMAVGVTQMNILFFQTTERNSFSTALSFLRCVGFIQLFLVLSVCLFDGKGLYLAFLWGELCHMILSQVLVQQTRGGHG